MQPVFNEIRKQVDKKKLAKIKKHIYNFLKAVNFKSAKVIRF